MPNSGINLEVSGFPFFAIFAKNPVSVHPVYMIFPCSSADPGPSFDVLNVADVANVLVANSQMSPRHVNRFRNNPISD